MSTVGAVIYGGVTHCSSVCFSRQLLCRKIAYMCASGVMLIVHNRHSSQIILLNKVETPVFLAVLRSFLTVPFIWYIVYGTLLWFSS